MDSDDEILDQTFSYLTLRKTIGWISILLPFVLMLGKFLISKGIFIYNSISHYYYSEMRDIFVGAICAIALFLFFYKGYNKWDNWAGNLAGIFAIGIALFPTAEKGAYNWVADVHLICASSFFLILAVFSLVLFTLKDPDHTKQKRIRNKIYIVCGSVMIVCLISIVIFVKFYEDEYPESSFVFWAESFALIAFGVSWLTKGGTICPDKEAGNITESEKIISNIKQ